MVTIGHEGPIQIIRDNPEVIAQILRTAFDVEVSDDLVIRTTSETFTQIAPAAYVADNVVEICEGGSTEPTIAVVAETQNQIDKDKRGSWPVYLTALHAKTDCPCYLIVFCPKRYVAAWARQTIRIGHPDFNLTPLVIGPGIKPLVTTTDQAAQAPEMAILGTLANVTRPTKEAMEITHAALATIENAGHENATLYTDLVLSSLPRAARRILEELVNTGTAEYKFKSDFALRNQAIGEAKGKAKGKAEGKAEGEAVLLLTVLKARRICVSDEVRDRVMACKDEQQLIEWATRAVTAESADELFD